MGKASLPHQSEIDRQKDKDFLWQCLFSFFILHLYKLQLVFSVCHDLVCIAICSTFSSPQGLCFNSVIASSVCRHQDFLSLSKLHHKIIFYQKSKVSAFQIVGVKLRTLLEAESGCKIVPALMSLQCLGDKVAQKQ